MLLLLECYVLYQGESLMGDSIVFRSTVSLRGCLCKHHFWLPIEGAGMLNLGSPLYN